ncbi:hypothetical protein [Aeromicrobium wangtongii]|uniref:Secreted protein n=1 Tax=Aeromicrobium wangtongii TaxID=2969247 RepID=A0ABY5M845_9ACTN|nr:hypothetical protein [Aeromicrobium wangtongii]MCD9199276.1 hypothetical protein [Aeromicrobium wangtongii]UUP13637.1 hypothetical protein NQV15_17580 [Aeromicrobium wangtongii]
MTATSGDWLRRAAPALFIVVSLGLAACGGSDSEPAEKKVAATTAEPTVDQAAADEQALEKLVTDFWSVRVAAQNSGEATPEQFAAVLEPGLVEVELGTVRDYKSLKVRRIGAPEITGVEVVAAGDTAELLACLDEDGWAAEEDGKPVELPKTGKKAWGAKAERNGDRWLINDFLSVDESKAKKTC